MLGIPLMLWQGAYNRTLMGIISFVRAQQLVTSTCLAYLAYVLDVSSYAHSIDFVHLLLEFIDVFPTNIYGLPLTWSWSISPT